MPKNIRKSLFWLAALSMAGLGFNEAVARKHKPQVAASKMEALIEACHDGDTCTATDGRGLRYKLRLVGIDAPEVASYGSHQGGAKAQGQSYGPEAREYLRRRVVGKTLKIEILGNDIYGRYLAILRDEKSVNINEELVLKGYAFAYRSKRKSEELPWAFTAEAKAKAAQAGLWGLPFAQRPAYPGEFRHSR